ncbi:MAG: potassium/proton antiporter [Nitriliruptoraceae bacterium]
MTAGLPLDRIVFVAAALMIGAVLISAVASRPHSRLRIPGALLFLTLGMVVGTDGLGWVGLDDQLLVRDLGVVALLIILFEGGLTTKPTDLKRAAVPGLALSTVGVLVTAGVTALAAWLIFDLDPVTAGLLGSVVASTDAAAVFSMMRTTPLPRRVSAVLRIESGANDPIAIMLTVGLLATIENGAMGPAAWARFAAVQILAGVAAGAVCGAGAVWVLRRVNLGIAGLYPVLAAAFGALAYGTAALVGGSGFVAVYLAGLAIGSFVPRHRRGVLGFHEAMANAAEVGLFLLLGLLVFPSRLPEVALPGLAVVGVLVFVARPLAVWLCTLGSRFTWREQAVVSLAGLRGAVPIVLATFPYTAGIAGGSDIFDVVFFVVLVSVLVQGSSLLPVVRLLGLESSRPAWAPVAEALPLDEIDIDLVELFVTDDLRIANRRLAELPELGDSRVAAIVRDDRVLVARGDTMILPGDVLLLTAQRQGDVLERITAWARGETATAPPLASEGEDPPPVGTTRDARDGTQP